MKNEQQSAYPTDGAHNQKGLSKLEAFTMAAMQANITWLYNASAPGLNGWTHEDIARESIAIAKATLSRLKKEENV